MEIQSISLTKQTLRESAKRIRQMFSEAEIQQKSMRICQFLENWEIFRRVKSVVFFAPLPGEPDLLHVAERFLPTKQIGFPVVTGHHLRVKQVTHLSELQQKSFKISEPECETEEESMQQAELILVPALGFDRQGNRLGFGKGYFDRFLSTHGGIFAGVIFEEQVFAEIPIEPHDVSMHYIITESGVYKTSLQTGQADLHDKNPDS